jgi:hypothetical protein
VHKTPFSPGELWVQTGTFLPEHHNFVEVVKAPDSLSIPDFSVMNGSEIMTFLQKDVFLLFPKCELTASQIANKSPLMKVTLMKLSNNYAVWSLQLSHCLGDGVTFFMLLKQISMVLSGGPNASSPPPMLNWNVPAKPTHELFPPAYSARDIHVAYGPPFMLGAARNVLTQQNKRPVRMFLLNKHVISDEKRRLRAAPGCSHVSSNDIITAALCQATHSSDVFIFTENVRGRKVGIPVNAAGNFLLEMSVPRSVAMQPEALREVVQSQGYYAANELPVGPFVAGRVGRVTSMASIAESFVYKGTKSLATLPLTSFLEEIPLDVALIFRYNKDYWGVLHNVADFRPTPLLERAMGCEKLVDQ